MTKIALITDQHFGARNDSQLFLDFYEQFYSEVFFPTLLNNGVKHLLVLGDTFDRRKFINFNTLQRAKKMFFDKLEEYEIDTYMLVGNHDTFYKNTNDVNSVRILGGHHSRIRVIDSPQTITINEQEICMIPWICADNYTSCIKEINDTKASLCAGHFEIEGFVMYRGHPCQEGLSRDIFRKFEFTFSGHYHHKSNSNGIHYLGNPYELTWQDYQDDRGFHILDVHSRDLVFYKNPFVMYHRILYNDAENDYSNIDVSHLKGKYVKVVVVSKTSPYTFDRYMDMIYSSDPADVSIVEDFTDLSEGLDEDMVNQSEDTLTILNKTVDTISEPNIDNTKLKNILRELYIESLSVN